MQHGNSAEVCSCAPNTVWSLARLVVCGLALASQMALALFGATSGIQPCVARGATPSVTDASLLPTDAAGLPPNRFGDLASSADAGQPYPAQQGVDPFNGQSGMGVLSPGPLSLASLAEDDAVVQPGRTPAPGSAAAHVASDGEPFGWHLMPQGLLYPAYLAGPEESRFGTQCVYERNSGPVLDSSLGAHVGVLRYGQVDGPSPDGSQWDFEGAAFPRLELSDGTQLVSTDYRFGTLDTFRRGPWEAKFGYYHLCSHLGDTFLEENPFVSRISYIRDALVLGGAMRPLPDLRFYCEIGYAVHVTGYAQPWEIQFGGEFVRAVPGDMHGGPFVAVNSHLREENNFGGNVTIESGWAWRSEADHLMRLGLYYFNGMSAQRQFYDQFEEDLGVGLWYDF